jgi:hypothetical protein
MVGIPIISHVLPSLAIIGELVARGQRVTYANDPAVADPITATGAEFVPCTSGLPVADDNWPDDPIAAMNLFLDDAVAALPQLSAAYRDDPADLYMYDIGARRNAGPSRPAVVPDIRGLGRVRAGGRGTPAATAGCGRLPGAIRPVAR